jgi:anti-sigma B factor antagonist
MTMFEIERAADGAMILVGRLDAAQAPKAQAALDALTGPCRLDCARLEYVSSAGLGVLLKTQKRLGGLTLFNVSPHIMDVFRYSGFDQIFRIEARAPDAHAANFPPGRR